MTAAKLWLTEKDYYDDACTYRSEFQVWFLWGYRYLNDIGEISEKFIHYIDGDFKFRGFTAAAIEDLAERAHLDKTTHWYTGVGWILYRANKTERAIELLEKAIDLVSRSLLWHDLNLTLSRITVPGSLWKL